MPCEARVGLLLPGLPACVRVKSDRFSLRPDQCPELTRRVQPDCDCISFEVAVVGFPRVARHRDGLVADVLDFVDRASLGERPAGGVVAGERDGDRATHGAHRVLIVSEKVPLICKREHLPKKFP